MIFDLLAVMAPVFICVAIGFTWEKLKFPYNLKEITPLIVNVGTPFLVVATLLNADLSMTAFGQTFGYALLVHVATAALGIVVLLLLRLDQRTFLPAIIFSNAGNMGLPLCLFAFGPEGLALGIAYFCVSSIGQFTIGATISSGEMNMRRLATSTLIWGILFSLGMIAFDLSLPDWAMNTVELIAGMSIPLMLIGLGVSVARLKVTTIRTGALLSIVRLAGGVAIGWGIAEIFVLEGVLRGVVIIQSAMPVALFNYLFATYYGRNPEQVAAMVVVSTGAGFVILPAVLWLALG